MSVRNSKALVGALFVQYCAYGIFYILDDFKKLAPSMYKPVAEAPAEEAKEDEPPKSKMQAIFSQRAVSEQEREEHRKWEGQRL